MSTQKIAEVLEILKKKNYKIVNEEENGIEFLSKDGSHKCFLTPTTISFTSVANIEMSYAFAPNPQEVNNFFRTPKDFAAVVKPVVEKKKSEPKPKTPKAEKPVKEKKEKVIKEKAPSTKTAEGYQGPSVRGEVLRLLDLNTPREDILKHLLTLGTGRDEKSLRNQISLNVSHHKEILKKREEAAKKTPELPITQEAPVTPAIPEVEVQKEETTPAAESEAVAS